MTSPFSFHKGNGKKLHLKDVSIYNHAVIWDEDTSFSKGNLKVDFKKWITSVLKWLGSDSEEGINTIIDNSLSGVFDELIKEVTDYLLEENDDSLEICNVFSGKKQTVGKLKVAIIQCNFADINQIIYSIENELLNNIDVRHKDTIRISSCGIPINNLIDRIRDTNCSLITIEQVESMSSEYIDQLFSLLASFNILVPVLVCVSTSTIMFTSLCSQRTLELLKSKPFSFALSDKIFLRVMSALKSIKDIGFCGELLRFIRTQFFASDFSVSSIKKAVRFSILQQFLKNPTWFSQNEVEFTEEVNAYNILLTTLCAELNKHKGSTDEYIQSSELHEEIQLNKDWFKELSNCDIYKGWRHSLSLLKLYELSDFVNEIVSLMKDDYEGLTLSLNNLIETGKETGKLDEKNIELEVPTPVRKMRFCEYQAHSKKKMDERSKNSQIAAREKVILAIEKAIVSVLRPWTTFAGSKNFLHGVDCIAMLMAHPSKDMEQALLSEQEYSKCALSIAFQTLINQNKWKTITIASWGRTFAERIEETLNCNAVPAFFSSLGHLEYIGIVRCGAERKSTITVIYHPMSYLA